MKNTPNCIKKSKEVYEELKTSDRVSKLALRLRPHPGNYAFRIVFTKQIIDASNNIVSGISISIPVDAIGNRGPEPPYNEPIIPKTIETALISEDEDIQHFFSVNDLIEHLEHFANGSLQLRS